MNRKCLVDILNSVLNEHALQLLRAECRIQPNLVLCGAKIESIPSNLYIGQLMLDRKIADLICA